MSSISLLGWDTANVIGFNPLNQLLFPDKTLPNVAMPFDFTSDAQDSIRGCKFEFWALTNGGADTNLFMKARLSAGTIQIGSAVVPLTGKLITFQVNLKFFNETGDASDPYLLKIDPTAQLTVVSTDFDTDTTLSAPVRFGIKGVFEEYLNQNIAAINQVFHTAVLEPADGTLPWVMPSGLGYAVSNGQFEKTSVFAVLATTEGRTPGTLANQIDPTILDQLPTTANSAFVISQEMLTRNLLGPAALTIFGSASESDFGPSSDGLGFENINQVTWGNFQLDDGSTISPTIPPKGFSITVPEVGDRIRLSFTGVTYSTPAFMGGNIVTTMSFTQDIFLKYDPVANHLIPTFQDPANPDVRLTIGDAQISVEADSTAKTLEWVEIGIGAALLILGVVGIGRVAFLKATASAADVSGNAANATVNGTQLNIIYSQLPAHPAANFVPQAIAAAPQAAAALQTAATVTNAGTALWKTAILASLGVLGGITGLGLGIAKTLEDNTLVSFAEGKLDGAPSFTDFTDACFERSKWPNMKSWTPVGVKLNGVLLIYGTLVNSP